MADEVNTDAAIEAMEQGMRMLRGMEQGVTALKALRSLERRTSETLKTLDEAVASLESVRAETDQIAMDNETAKVNIALEKQHAEKVAAETRAEADRYALDVRAKTDKEAAAADAALKKQIDATKEQADEYVQTKSDLVKLQRELENVRKAAAALAKE